jgi:hypothetical protein
MPMNTHLHLFLLALPLLSQEYIVRFHEPAARTDIYPYTQQIRRGAIRRGIFEREGRCAEGDAVVIGG